MFPVCKMGRPDCVGEKRHEIQEQNGIIHGLGGAGVGGGHWGDRKWILSEDLNG